MLLVNLILIYNFYHILLLFLLGSPKSLLIKILILNNANLGLPNIINNYYKNLHNLIYNYKFL